MHHLQCRVGVRHHDRRTSRMRARLVLTGRRGQLLDLSGRLFMLNHWCCASRVRTWHLLVCR